MIPKLLCGSCGNELSPQDKFCSRCGEQVNLNVLPTKSAPSEDLGGPPLVACTRCGSENPSNSTYCGVCGAVMASEGSSSSTAEPKSVGAVGGRSQARRERKRERQSDKSSGSEKGRKAIWKIPALVGGSFVVALIIIGVQRNRVVTVPNTPQSQSSASATMMQDIEQLRKVVEANPTEAASILKLANLLHDGKFTDQAIVYYKKYLVLEEKDPDARVDLGICYYENGDHKAAIAEMEKALRFSPRHQLAHFNLGIVNLGVGNVETAMDWFRKCIALSPDSETAKRAKRLIDQHSATSSIRLNKPQS